MMLVPSIPSTILMLKKNGKKYEGILGHAENLISLSQNIFEEEKLINNYRGGMGTRRLQIIR